MPVIANDTVVLLSGNNGNFGSGFIIAENEQLSYVVSCAHVVEDIGEGLRVDGLPAEIEKIGSADGLDLAILKVAKLNRPCLNRFALGITKTDIATLGYSSFEKGQAKRELDGKLGKTIQLTVENQRHELAAFDVSIQDDDFSKLAGGYSGSPLCNQAGAVIGVVSHRRNGEQGHAFCISNLKILYAEIEQLAPGLKNWAEKSRLANIIDGLQARQNEISVIYEALFKHLKQIENDIGKSNNDDFLSICENFLKNTIPTNIFITCCQSLITSATPPDEHFNYQRLVEDLRNGKIALCLGFELQLSISNLSQQIAGLTGFRVDRRHALSEVCEYAELHEDCRRHRLQTTLEQAVRTANAQNNHALYQLLGNLDQPFLVIATGFDCLLTDHLRSCGKRFVKIITDPGTQKEHERYQLHFSDLPDQTCSDEQLSPMRLMEKGYSIIYYPRGYAQQDQATLLLSERDYFNAGDLLNKRYPAYLHNKLKTRGLWFLGHHPDSWENRLLALGLQHQRSLSREKPLAIQPQADSFSKLFWQDMPCQHDDNLSLDEFVRQLENAMP